MKPPLSTRTSFRTLSMRVLPMSFIASSPAIITRSLLCLHGFDMQPIFKWLETCATCTGQLSVVPVIWPRADRKLLRNALDRKAVTPEAANAFDPLLTAVENVRKSILCHSTGNFVLKAMATQGHARTFDDIFMVAADVERDLFDASNNRSHSMNENHGLNIANMVRNKVHVLHSKRDMTMIFRRLLKGGKKALGEDGVDRDKLEPALSNKVANFDCTYFTRGLLGHNYLFEKRIISGRGSNS